MRNLNFKYKNYTFFIISPMSYFKSYKVLQQKLYIFFIDMFTGTSLLNSLFWLILVFCTSALSVTKRSFLDDVWELYLICGYKDKYLEYNPGLCWFSTSCRFSSRIHGFTSPGYLDRFLVHGFSPVEHVISPILHFF